MTISLGMALIVVGGLQYLLFQLLLIKIGANMNELNAAVSRIEASIAAANAKIDSLKAGTVDPAALAEATARLNAASDLLDAKVAS